MAGDWYGIALVTICINMFLYIGAAQMGATVVDFGDDVLAQFVVGGFDSDNMLADASNKDISMNKSILTMPGRDSPEVAGSQFLEILNSLDVVWDVIDTVLNLAFAPLVLFQIEGMPYVLAFVLAIPLQILFWMSIIQFIRGAS